MSGGISPPIVPVIKGGKVTGSLRKLGGGDLFICYQCGSCTAICPLSEELDTSFRKAIRYAQLELEDRLLSDPLPWLCYYCGECTKTCPRDAKPSRIMDSLRRYLISKYDWTHVAGLVQSSKLYLALANIVLFVLGLLFIYLIHGPMNQEKVDLSGFLPPSKVELMGISVGIVSLAIILGGLYRSYRFIMHDIANPVRGPLSSLPTLAKYLLLQFPMNRCENKRRWIDHLLIFYGFLLLGMMTLTLFIVLTVAPNPEVFASLRNPSTPLGSAWLLLGAVASAMILYSIISSIVNRLRGKDIYYITATTHTDIAFIIVVLLITLTGIFVLAFRLLNQPILTYYSYAIHLALQPLLFLIELPFSKFSHFIYRPFIAYFALMKGMRIPNVVLKRGVGGGLL
ncbi:MAG: 4Fe-4S dicluster domain-containing protein [Candidatus Methanodesulfokora sp.]